MGGTEQAVDPFAVVCIQLLQAGFQQAQLFPGLVNEALDEFFNIQGHVLRLHRCIYQPARLEVEQVAFN